MIQYAAFLIPFVTFCSIPGSRPAKTASNCPTALSPVHGSLDCDRSARDALYDGTHCHFSVALTVMAREEKVDFEFEGDEDPRLLIV
jgi:hypothetical protein